MGLEHFRYILEGRTGHTKVASDLLELLAKTAAKRFLDEGAPLNATIMKLASENDLNSEQIRRVCEMANISSHQALWVKTAEKDKIAFELADAENILKVVGKNSSPGAPSESCGCGDPCGCKGMAMANTKGDYMGPPTGIPSQGPSIASLMGADPSKVHNGLHEEPERKRIIIVLQKKAGQRSALASEVAYKGMQLESLEKQAFRTVKQAVLGGESFGDLLLVAAAGGLSKIAAEYFPQWEDELISGSHGDTRNRLKKEAIARAPDDLISDDLGNMTVINGAHPVIVSLDTIQRKTGEIKNGIHNLLRIDDEVKVFNQRLRELS